MKILVSKKLKPLGLAAAHAGFQVMLFDQGQISTFDAFDRFEPEVCIIDPESIDYSMLKCIQERPHLRIAVFSDLECGEDDDKYEKELQNVVGDNYYLRDYFSIWDIVSYKDAPLDYDFISHLSVVESSPIFGIENLPDPVFTGSMGYRIFSTCRVINHPNFCGIISEQEKPSIFKSSGYILTNKEDVYNAIMCGCPATHRVESVTDLLNTDRMDISQQQRVSSKANSFELLNQALVYLHLLKEAQEVRNKSVEFI